MFDGIGLVFYALAIAAFFLGLFYLAERQRKRERKPRS